MSEFVFSTPGEVPLHGRWEAAFIAEGQPPPTTEFIVVLISPTGQRHVRPGFWDGANVWRVRFMPTEEGEWQYHTASNPIDGFLHRRHGSFFCRRGAAWRAVPGMAETQGPAAYGGSWPIVTPYESDAGASPGRSLITPAPPRRISPRMLPQSAKWPSGRQVVVLGRGGSAVETATQFPESATGLSETSMNPAAASADEHGIGALDEAGGQAAPIAAPAAEMGNGVEYSSVASLRDAPATSPPSAPPPPLLQASPQQAVLEPARPPDVQPEEMLEADAQTALLDPVESTLEPLVETNAFLEHGPVMVAAGGHFFTHRDGTPFFFMADTAWNGTLLSTEQDWDTYLNDRVNKGFTAVQVVPIAPWVGAYANAEAEVGYTGHPYFPINPHFFRRLDQRMDAINAKGLLAVPVMLWAAPFGEASAFNPGITLSEDQMVFIARYLVARYGAHHVIWLLAGDGYYDREMADRWRQVGRAIFDGIDHAPVGMHPCGLQWPYDDYRSEGWLDLAGYQSSHSDGSRTLHWIQRGPPALWWRMRPPRPVINLEPCYEDCVSFHSRRPITRDQVRRAIYWSLLNAPTAGVTYGAHGVWSWEASSRVPLNHPATGAAKPWYEAMRLPGSYDMQRMMELIRSIKWWELRPDGDLLQSTGGDRTPARFISSSRSHSGDTAVFYLPKGGEVRVRMELLLPNRQGQWFDPRTAARFVADPVRPGVYSIPDEQDWVLVLG